MKPVTSRVRLFCFLFMMISPFFDNILIIDGYGDFIHCWGEVRERIDFLWAGGYNYINLSEFIGRFE